MEEQSSTFLTLQFTLNRMGLLDSLSKMKRLPSVYIVGALRTWLCLRFFEGSLHHAYVLSFLKQQGVAQIQLGGGFSYLWQGVPTSLPHQLA